MRHIKHWLMTAVLLLCSVTASAEAVEIDGIWYNLVTKTKQAEMVSSKGAKYSGDIMIPSTIIHDGAEYCVTSIGSVGFAGCTSLTSVTISKGVISISASAFSGCTSLISVTIPEGVISIGSSAFKGCTSLTSVELPEGVEDLEYGLFNGCSNLSSIIIPESVTSIGDYAFQDCSKLTSITIPQNVTSIGNYAFSGCKTLNSVTFSEDAKLTSIGKRAFAFCGFTSINIPEGVSLINESAFAYCSKLTSATLPKSLVRVEMDAFVGCEQFTSLHIKDLLSWCNANFTTITAQPLYYAHNLYLNGELVTELVIPEGVTTIKARTFWGCHSITSVSIPKSTTKIKVGAFSGCNNLKTISISESVTTLEDNSIGGCPELTDVYCYAKNVPSASSSAFNGSYVEYATLHVPTSALANYKATAPWSNFGNCETASIAVGSITLSPSSVTLTEGESIFLTITIAPDNAEDESVSWSSSDPSVATVDNTGEVTAIAPGSVIITATANDGSGVSASCEVTVKEKLLGKCDVPMVNYAGGKVVLTCTTEEVEYVTSVVPDNELNYQVHEFDFIPTYTFNVYAAKAKYENSDVVSVTICWIDCAEDHEDSETTDILTIPSQPVLIQSANGVITLTGLADGTAVEIYNLNGMAQGSATAVNGTAAITTSLEAGSTAIVKIAERSVKVAVK